MVKLKQKILLCISSTKYHIPLVIRVKIVEEKEEKNSINNGKYEHECRILY